MTRIVAITAILVAGFCTTAMNWRFSYQLGTTAWDSYTWAIFSVALDVTKWLMLPFAALAWRNHKLRSVAAFTIWFVATIYSFTAAIGFAALNRETSVSERQAQADLLTSDSWDRAPLRTVVETALLPFQYLRFTLEGPDIWLDASKSLQMTLAVHELATNAAKYGALSNPTGRVHFTWELLDSGMLSFRWEESGGPPATCPKQKGFGSILLEHTFESTCFEYLPDGLICKFEMPT